MIVFDFFNDNASELIEKFCDYFRLDSEQVFDYFTTVNPDNLTPEVLVKKFDLKLIEYNSADLQIVCRHMTTAAEEDLLSFVEKGILDLRTMLQEDTTLSRFLLNHKIKVFVDERKIKIRGKVYPILSSKETCEECYQGRERVCSGYSKCDTFKELISLATKLYLYEATVECFIHATLEEMQRYSTLDRCPEILNTLDNIVSAVNGQYSTTFELSYDWMAEKKNCYVLEYKCPWSEMETFAPIIYEDAYRDYKWLLATCGYDYSAYMNKEIPKRVYDNITFLKRFISIFFYNAEEYGSLLAGGTVAPESLKIYQVEKDKLALMKL